jgi:hypothetical protein
MECNFKRIYDINTSDRLREPQCKLVPISNNMWDCLCVGYENCILYKTYENKKE